MKRTAFLVNTARGAVVDEEALAWALEERLIAGAALDVFEREPHVQPDLLTLENVVLAPHLGSATRETRTAMAELAARNVVAVLRRKPPDDACMRCRPARRSRDGRDTDPGSRCCRALARAIRGMDELAVEKISDDEPQRPVPGARRDDAVGADEGCGDRTPRRRVCFEWRRHAATMASPPYGDIERLIYPVSFYRIKARHVRETCRQLLARFGGARAWPRWTISSRCRAWDARPRISC